MEWEAWAEWAEVEAVRLLLLSFNSLIAFGNKKMQMVFIYIRDGYMDPKGIEKMAKDF